MAVFNWLFFWRLLEEQKEDVYYALRDPKTGKWYAGRHWSDYNNCSLPTLSETDRMLFDTEEKALSAIKHDHLCHFEVVPSHEYPVSGKEIMV